MFSHEILETQLTDDPHTLISDLFVTYKYIFFLVVHLDDTVFYSEILENNSLKWYDLIMES